MRADSPAHRGHDGSVPRGPHDDRRRRAPRTLPHRQATSTQAVRRKRSLAVRLGQCRSVTRQGDMPKRLDVRGATNGPPTRP